MDLTSKDKKFIKFTSRLIDKSLHIRYKMAAILVRGSNIVSIGINRQSPKPFYIKNDVGERGLHAEVDCLRMVSRKTTRGSTLYIQGRTAAGNTITSKPCNSCIEHLKRMKIRNIVYTNIHGELVKEKINE